MRVSLIRFAARSTRLTREPFVDIPQEGRILLNNAALNKGSAFTDEERDKFKLRGLLPTKVNTLDVQVSRAYHQMQSMPTDLAKNQFCESLKVQNEVLFYALVKKHLREMMSIIYTPTQGDAIAAYSQLFRRPTGCFLDINSPEQSAISARLQRFGEAEDIDYIVVTDAEGILGIGDQGVGGIGIAISKLVLMTVCGGVHPNRVIPVVLDCGTNNERLLNDPLYMGNPHKRVTGERYDTLVDNFVQVVKRNYPDAVLHFEDFGGSNAHRLLAKYQDQLPCFNDDIQGTGAVTMAALKSGLASTGTQLQDARVVIYGAGSAGVGIAKQIVDNLTTQGLSAKDARRNIYLIDRKGLIMRDREEGVNEHQRPFAADAQQFADIDRRSLYDIVKKVKPHVLIGCSTQAGAFTREIVEEMASHVDRPIIFPLSNPTRLHEATPKDLIEWTQGRVLVATGSPFKPVNGRRISENNNCFIFPGIGLGAVLSRAKRINKKMLAAAVDELASLSPILNDLEGPLLPDISDINDISALLATSVVLAARDAGLAQVEQHRSSISDELVEIPEDWEECYQWVKSQMWVPEYRRYRRAKTYVMP